MNLKILSNESMLNTSGFFLEDKKTRKILRRRLLGKAMLEQIQEAHDLMLTTQKRRQDIESALTRLNQEIGFLDACYVRKARGFCHLLAACIEGLDDPELAALCGDLVKACFPDGLEVINLSYLDKAGRARLVQKQVDEATLLRMDAVVMGPKSLGIVFREWIAAGILLGQKTSERARMQSAAQRSGASQDTVNVNTVRSRWIRTMRSFLGCMDLMKLGPAEYDALRAPIAHAVANTEHLKKTRAASAKAGDAKDRAEAALGAAAIAESGVDAPPGAHTFAIGASRIGVAGRTQVAGLLAAPGRDPTDDSDRPDP